MARGGVRVGAGRPPGSANLKTREIADRAAAEGITPLDVMLKTMRALWKEAAPSDEIVDMEKAVMAHAIAKDAAPFIHAKLSNISADVTGHVSLTSALDAIEP